MKTLFIVPNNDAEALKIQEMLKREGKREGEDFVITGQQWGASWENLEEEIKSKIKEYEKVYGIELKGAFPGENCENVDHHVYYEGEQKEEFKREKTSLEQMAKMLGVELTVEEKFYAANDIGYIPEMKKLGERLGVSEEEISAMIKKVNDDEAKAQGVTEEMKEIARRAVENGYIYDQRLIVVDIPEFKAMREVTNILYEMGKHNDMYHDTTVINTHDKEGRIIVFGRRDGIIGELIKKYPEKSWTGGKEAHGYFGIQLGENDEKKKVAGEIVDFLEEKILGYHRLVEREDIIKTEKHGPNLNIHHISDPKVFYRAICAAKGDNEHGAFVHSYEAEEYKDMKLFIVNAGAAGIAVKKDGDVISVFKNPDMARKDDIEKINKELLLTAIDNGGKKLDCFDGFLPELYSRFGFEPGCWIKFNDEFAPEGWDFERDGRPDILFMIHNGDTVETIKRKQAQGEYKKYAEIKEATPYVENYDKAVELVSEKLMAREREKQKERTIPLK
jgi:hypothetical protein